MARPYTCPHCRSTRTIWKGHRIRQDGKVRLRKCRKCGRKFTTKKIIRDTRGDAS